MKLNEEQKKLVEDNFKFVYSYAHKNIGKCYNLSFDELVSIYSLALCKAARNFDPTRGSKFLSLVSICMDNELKMNFRKNKRSNCEIPMSEFTNNESGEDFNSEDLFEELSYRPIDSLMLDMSIKERLNKLTEKEKKIFSLYVINELNQRNVGKALGISQSYSSRLIHKLMDKFKEAVVI
jgi:RNA polymerase sporulation-specific sigma factor